MTDAQKNHAEPVALPERRPESVSFFPTGWNACLDEIAKLGPLFTHPAPAVQQEPVAWRYRWSLEPNKPWIYQPTKPVDSRGYDIEPLYTHAAPGEVERLQRQIANAELALKVQTQNCEALRAQLAELHESQWKITQYAIKLQSQLAEAHSLLRDLQQYGTVDWDRLNAVLSVSAEQKAKTPD